MASTLFEASSLEGAQFQRFKDTPEALTGTQVQTLEATTKEGVGAQIQMPEVTSILFLPWFFLRWLDRHREFGQPSTI